MMMEEASPSTQQQQQAESTVDQTTAAAATTTAPEAQQQQPTIVVAENLSPQVSAKNLSDFFSLCGVIKTITLLPSEASGPEGGKALIHFEAEGAASTAVLLTNSILHDRPITIRYFNPAGLLLLITATRPCCCC